VLALLDLGLFVLDPAAWNADRARCEAPILAMTVHDRFLRRYPVRLLWSEAFFGGFPWNQPRCPPALRDLCVVVTQLHDYLHGNQRLLGPETGPDTPPAIDPDLFDPGFPGELRETWLSLLGSVAVEQRPAREGLAIPTWERESIGRARALRITTAAVVHVASLLVVEADWQAFVVRHHRPDLGGKRVAVLGGNRAFFERAKERLAAYGLTDCRRLPPAYEETRTKQETRLRLQSVDLVVVCTNRLKHTDTDHLEGELSCARVMLDTDTAAQIEKAVVEHFSAHTPEPPA
jgi:hypothetical protein